MGEPPPVSAPAANGSALLIVVSAKLKPEVNAAQLAIRAASSRQLAVTTADMNKAWEASAAAAGALLMLERAQDDLRKLAAPPGL